MYQVGSGRSLQGSLAGAHVCVRRGGSGKSLWVSPRLVGAHVCVGRSGSGKSLRVSLAGCYSSQRSRRLCGIAALVGALTILVLITVAETRFLRLAVFNGTMYLRPMWEMKQCGV